MRRRYHFGLPFLLYCVLTILVGAAAVNSSHNLLFAVFALFLSVLALSIVASGAVLRGLEVRRIVPPSALVGEPVVLRYVVRNRRAILPALGIRVEEIAEAQRSARSTRLPSLTSLAWPRFVETSFAWITHIGPRQVVHGEAPCMPRQRGLSRFEALRVSTSFPFGIFRRSITIRAPQHLPVYPRLHALRDRVFEAIAPAGAVGTIVSPHAGAGDDVYGLREFRPGDSMRHIAWKRTANREELVAIERTRSQPPRLRVVVDLRTPTEAITVAPGEPLGARELEEQAISLAASIVHGAHERGFEVGLAILGLGLELEPLPVRRGHWHRHRIMSHFAAIDLDAPRCAEDALPPGRERVAHAVVHPDRVDPSVVRGDALHFTARQLPLLAEGKREPPHRAGRGETASGEERAA